MLDAEFRMPARRLAEAQRNLKQKAAMPHCHPSPKPYPNMPRLTTAPHHDSSSLAMKRSLAMNDRVYASKACYILLIRGIYIAGSATNPAQVISNTEAI
jgi:hypothetical protein